MSTGKVAFFQWNFKEPREMSTFDKINDLCKERGISVTKLETELGFGRGSIGKLKKGGSMSFARLQKVAQYFSVSVEMLSDGEDVNEENFRGRYISSQSEKPYYINAESLEMAQRILEDEELHALFKATMTIPKEDLALVEALVKRLRKTNTDE